MRGEGLLLLAGGLLGGGLLRLGGGPGLPRGEGDLRLLTGLLDLVGESRVRLPLKS